MVRLILILALFIPTVCAQSQQLIRKDLVENWEFSQAGLNEWLPAKVPGTVHTDLLANEKIKDPYFGIEERSVQWIDKVDWTYRTTFDLDPALLNIERCELVFEGLDTYATIWLNGVEVLRAGNMFLSWRIPVKEVLKISGNQLEVRFRSPIMEGLRKQSEYGIRLPAINDQSETGQIGKNQVSVFTRKAGYHFGWDWGPRLVPSGIWRPVYLEFWKSVKISDLFVTTISLKANEAKMHAELSVEAEIPSFCKLIIHSGRETWFAENILLVKGENRITREFILKNPRLWWPKGYGEPVLHRVSATLSDSSGNLAEYFTQVGIRTVELVQDPDPDGRGRSFYFEVNGLPVFAKGANYIPNDVFLPRVTPEEYSVVVGSAAFANMNMLRVWGGGIYENEIFYDLCDREGILVWQDFMFACSMYPGTEDFLASVTEEARQNIIRIRRHPCIALWCGNNEIEAAWGPYDENSGWGWKIRYTKEQQKQIWQAYDTVFHHILPEQVGLLNPTTPYWHSSPSAGMGIQATNETRSGDNHYWGVWHQRHPFEDYNKYISRFMSEYGFQSFPEFDAVKRYTVPEDWDIESEVMSSHQRSGIGNLRIREYMAKDYRIPGRFDHFLYVSHLLQAEGIRNAIEAHRRNKPYCMGSLYWQLNDCWPVASWSGTDFYRNYKALHYFAKKAFEPVVALAHATGDSVEFRLISDVPMKIRGILKIRVMNFEGRTLFTADQPVRIDPLGTAAPVKLKVSEITNNVPLTQLVVVSSFAAEGFAASDHLLYLVKPKDLELPQVKIKVGVVEESGHWTVSLSSDKLARNVMITWKGRAGIFSDNYFDLIPGRPVTVKLPQYLCPANPVNELATLSLVDTF